MNIFVLLYNSGTDKEGIHSIELKGRTIVLMFEDKDDATRYCGLLEAQDFPLPTVETIEIEEIKGEVCPFTTIFGAFYKESKQKVTFLESRDICSIHIWGTYRMFLRPLSGIVSFRY